MTNDDIARTETRGLIAVALGILCGLLSIPTVLLDNRPLAWALWGAGTVGGVFFILSYWRVWQWYKAEWTTMTSPGGSAPSVEESGSDATLPLRRDVGLMTELMNLSTRTPESSTPSVPPLSSVRIVGTSSTSPSTTDGGGQQIPLTDQTVRIRESLADWEKNLRHPPRSQRTDTTLIPRIAGDGKGDIATHTFNIEVI